MECCGGGRRITLSNGRFSVLLFHTVYLYGGVTPSYYIQSVSSYALGYQHKMQVSRFLSAGVVVMVATVALVLAAPQGATKDPPGPPDGEEAGSPEPYQYEYKVEDKETELYHGKEEKGDDTGRVEGKYYVWLPDKRLMTVTYYVDGESGFVPTITFEDNASPIGSRR